MEEIRFAHVSDTHIVAAGSSAFIHRVQREVRDPLENLAECLAALSCQNLDFLLLTGDLIHEGEAEDYRRYRALFHRYLPGVSLCCALGNHDRRAAFRQGFLDQQTLDEGPYLACAQVKGLQIISLDSPYTDGMRGGLPADQLNYLARQLENQPPRGSIVLMHNPSVAQQPWGAMVPPEEYRAILRQGGVKAVFAGHLHSAYYGWLEVVPQFTAGSLAFGIDMEPDASVYTNCYSYNMCRLDGQGRFSAWPVVVDPARRVLQVKRIDE